MCGRFNIIDNPLTKVLCEQLKLWDSTAPIRFSDDVAPASTMSIIHQQQNRQVSDAIWWLLLENTSGQYKANYKYASFNSRSDKLNKPNAIAYLPYRQSRCIIPASGFVEGQDKRYHYLQPTDGAIAFGGLYRSWQNQNDGSVIYSASIITLPGHAKFEHIHRKSLPLMLPVDNKPLIDAWLDPQFNHVSSFKPFLLPVLHQDFKATPIDKPSKRTPIASSELIRADQPNCHL